MNIDKYRSIVFDCDGVVLNSNNIKTEAFRKAVSSFGDDAVDKLISYHLSNGGISRYKKFNYFLKSIVPNSVDQEGKLTLHQMLNIYSYETEKGLLKAKITYGLHIMRNKMPHIRWSIVSGGDQVQLRYIFKQRMIMDLFDGGIYGSPDDKNEIIKREINNKNIILPALSLGDSKLDHEVASSNGLDFIFISEWTDFKDYKSYCKENSIRVAKRVHEIF